MWPFTRKKKEPLPLIPRESGWMVRYICHCGTYSYKLPTFCQRCGCENSFIKHIGKWVWDEDPNVADKYFRIDLRSDWELPNAKNIKWVEHTACSEKQNK